MSKLFNAHPLMRGSERDLAPDCDQRESASLKTILDTSPVGILEINREGIIVACSKSFEDMTGLCRQEIVGSPPFVGWMDGAVEEKVALRQVLHSGGSFQYARRFRRRCDGSLRSVSLQIEELRENGRITGAVLFVSETADASAASDGPEKILIRLDEVEHMEMLNRVMDQSAHDFNNMLLPIRSYPELIRLNYGDRDRVFKYLQAVEAAAEKMAERNRDLLILGRRGRYRRNRVEVNGVIEKALREARLPEAIVIHKRLSPDLLPVYGGWEELERLSAHLLKNAGQAMSCGGVLTVRTENYYLDHSARRYRDVAEGEYVKITIADTGPGIREEVLHQTGDAGMVKNTQGSNAASLGLKVVYGVLKDHKGYMDVEICRGKGTSFFIYLPIMREALPERIPASGSKKREKILIIDDDPGQLSLLRGILSALGYQVVAVQNGDEAVEVCRPSRTGDPGFDLLVMDMVLKGGIDGIATYRKIKDICPDQRSILISGFSPDERMEEMRRLGAGPYLKKPVDFSLLSKTIRSELDIAAGATLH